VRQLKLIHTEAFPRALELAERYRLLNEPEQAASICQDILAVDPENPQALQWYFLAMTDQFFRRHGAKLEDAEKIAARMGTDYDRTYYGAMACERWARAKLQEGAHASMVTSWLTKAMGRYEQAEGIRPPGNDDAILRWNACARLLDSLPDHSDRDHEPLFGD